MPIIITKTIRISTILDVKKKCNHELFKVLAQITFYLPFLLFLWLNVFLISNRDYSYNLENVAFKQRTRQDKHTRTYDLSTVRTSVKTYMNESYLSAWVSIFLSLSTYRILFFFTFQPFCRERA
jgi:hypothetical protein